MDISHIRNLKDQIETARHCRERVSVSNDNGKPIFGSISDTTPSGFTITGDGSEQSVQYSDVMIFDNRDAER